MGLREFVFAVLDRQLLRCSDILDSLEEERSRVLEGNLREWASQFRKDIEAGAYRTAYDPITGYDWGLWNWPAQQRDAVSPLLDANLKPVKDACELAERIDAFLHVLPRKTPLGLLQDCRTDLALLLILADWCEDHDQPLAATEARYLHGLVRVQLL